MTDLAYPDGLSNENDAERGGWRSHANLLSLLVLGSLMALALSGMLAGGRTSPRHADFDAAALDVSVPATLRNGEFFEMRIGITARATLRDLRIGLPPSLWRDLTINTMMPAASEEAFADGEFAFKYGALKAGETLAIKIDGQINPPLTWGTRGEIALYDGKRRLGVLPVTIRVLP